MLTLCVGSKLNKCTLYDYLNFLLFSTICMVVCKAEGEAMHQESKQRQRAGHSGVSEVDSVGASLEGIKLLYRAYKLSENAPCLLCSMYITLI